MYIHVYKFIYICRIYIYNLGYIQYGGGRIYGIVICRMIIIYEEKRWQDFKFRVIADYGPSSVVDSCARDGPPTLLQS